MPLPSADNASASVLPPSGESGGRRRRRSGPGSRRRRRTRTEDDPTPAPLPNPGVNLPLVPYEKPSGSLVFMTVGDWGGASDGLPATPSQVQTAFGMGRVAEMMGTEFVLNMGDNFYGTGVHRNNLWRFQRTYEDVYTHQTLKDIPWYQLAGNHDWEGLHDIQHQIEYTMSSDRWIFPSPIYSFRKHLPSGKTAKFVMFDNLMADKEYRWTPLAHDRFSGPRAEHVEWPEQEIPGETAPWEWLEQELENSADDDYLFLVDHKPVWTACSHHNTDELARVPEMMHKYRVTAFLSGHDHCLIHMKKDGLTFMVIGAGSQSWSKNRGEALFTGELGGSVDFLAADHNRGTTFGGFATMELTDSEMKVRYHDQNGAVLYEADSLRPRERRSGRSSAVV